MPQDTQLSVSTVSKEVYVGSNAVNQTEATGNENRNNACTCTDNIKYHSAVTAKLSTISYKL